MNEPRLSRIETAIDEVRTTLHAVDKNLVQQAALLREQMKRAKVNEMTLSTFKRIVDKDLEPIKKHVAGVNYLIKAIGVAAILFSAAFSILKAYDYVISRPNQGEKPNVPAEKPKAEPPAPRRK